MSKRAAIDASVLPENVFGHHSLSWWATLGFIVAEGTILAVTAVSVLYLRAGIVQWPPSGMPSPELGVPTVSLVLLLLTLLPAVWLDRAARRCDLPAVRRALVVTSLVALAALVARAFEFAALDVKWHENAWGSVTWTLLGLHASLMLIDLGETAGIAAISIVGPWEEKHFVDAADDAFYSGFMVLVWVPMYVVLYLLPRWS